MIAKMSEDRNAWPTVVLFTNPCSCRALTCREFGEDDIAELLESDPAGYVSQMSCVGIRGRVGCVKSGRRELEFMPSGRPLGSLRAESG